MEQRKAQACRLGLGFRAVADGLYDLRYIPPLLWTSVSHPDNKEVEPGDPQVLFISDQELSDSLALLPPPTKEDSTSYHRAGELVPLANERFQVPRASNSPDLEQEEGVLKQLRQYTLIFNLMC